MYRENIYDVMNATGEKISTLVIPKNTGLKGYAWQVLKEAGLKLDDAKQAGRNKLKLGGLTLVLKRGEDIPQLVADYAAIRSEVVLGVTGDDLFDEFKFRVPKNTLQVENTYDWFDENARYFRPTLCFINMTGNVEDVPLESRIAINGKYELTSRAYLRGSPLTQGKKFAETTYSGDIELTVAEGTNDCCIDTVYTRKTLDENGLKVIQKIRFSDLVVISPLKKKKAFLER